MVVIAWLKIQQMSSNCFWVLLMTLVLAVGCAKTDSAPATYDHGLSDGLAVGYNKECKRPPPKIAAEWDNDEYFSGYKHGYFLGVSACRREVWSQ